MDRHGNITREFSEDESMNSTLIIRSIQEEDYGTYAVTATNSYGHIDVNFELLIPSK